MDELESMLDQGKSFSTMSDLAKQLKISLRTLYEIAPSKEELIVTTVDRVLKKHGKIAIDAMNAQSTPIRKLESFLPVDSEHFSIFSLLENNNNKIEKIYITASGGPFINLPRNKFDKIKPKDALKHPNWSMGKKITIDSATLMNKVFEVIEAKNIFNLDYEKITILTHPKSYVHAIIKFKDGLTKILTHDPDMKIPILNSLYFYENINYKSKPLDFNILNNLKLKKVDLSKFSTVKILNDLPKYPSLFETVLVTINDYLVFKFLDKKISFEKLIYLINKITKLKEFQKYKKIKPKKPEDIHRLNAYVSSKMDSFSI